MIGDYLKPLTYKASGVDVEAGNEFVKRIRPLVRSTFRPEVITDIGAFGGLFSFSARKFREPVLVSATDGVGTKLKVAFLTGKHDTVGIDLVAMCVNDVVVHGAEPLFFLDYLATGKLSLETATQVLKGIVRGCRLAGCALIGGETAEMPAFYKKGEYDLAGFTVGVVERKKVIDGSAILPGDQLIGLASSGLHSNGFSLARKVFFQMMGLGPGDRLAGLRGTVAQELLRPTRIYVRTVLELVKEFPISGISHITGGGITENLPRVLPPGCRAVVERGSWPVPSVFRLIHEEGRVSEEEMLRTFNNGLGLILAVPARKTTQVLSRLRRMGERAYRIGEIVKAGKDEGGIRYR
ncbi:MAG: phosphoribosylformylglycinamidine cyclo-ligase [Deltaproteobacteria bacterium]|nr:phosphoribosylformylglycinamidine cyclo-ligase [Deltaproteobacteria bacterium]